MKILRIFIALFGSYLLTSLITVTLSLSLAFKNPAESTLLASMLSFVFYLLFVLYCFYIKSVKRLLIYFVLLSIFFYLLNTYVLA